LALFVGCCSSLDTHACTLTLLLALLLLLPPA
jgi:hypothetical protein